MKIKIVLHIIARVLAGFVSFVLLYLLIAFALPLIGVLKENEKTSAGLPIAIFLVMDGVHTDVVLPFRNQLVDWRNMIKFQNGIRQNTLPQFVAFGWGDKNFYINTPTWAQLKFSTAFQAVCGLSTSAIHTTFYKQLKESAMCKKIMLSGEQYLRLAAYIKCSFKLGADGKPIIIKPNAIYNNDDAFYDANGRYSLFFTCNTWANNALKACGQKACLWTVFENGIAYQYRDWR